MSSRIIPLTPAYIKAGRPDSFADIAGDDKYTHMSENKVYPREGFSCKNATVKWIGGSLNPHGTSRLQEGQVDIYEPGTVRERAYMCGISSIYYTDSIVDSATIADSLIQNETQDYIKVEVGSIASDGDSDVSDAEVGGGIEVQNETQDCITIEVGNSFN